MSLRVRLLVATALIAVVALVGADIATYSLLRSSLVNQIDDGLKLSVQAVESSLTATFPGDVNPSGAASVPRARFLAGACQAYKLATGAHRPVDTRGLIPGTVIEVRNAAGAVVYHCRVTTLGTSSGTPVLTSSDDPSKSAGRGGQSPSFSSVSSTGGGNGFRVAALSLLPPGGGSGGGGSGAARELLVAVPLTGTAHTLSTLLDLEIVVTAIAVAVALGLGAWLVRLGLRPLRAVELTAAAIADGQLAERVPGDTKRTEVGRLARALNVMLERIQLAFAERDRTEADLRASEERMRRFVGDASHELRTPVAAVAAYAELFERGAAERPDDLRRVLRGIRTESGRMGHLVEDLLLLARLDEGRALQPEPVDLVALAADAVAAASVVGPQWPVRLEADEPVEVVADGMRLRQVLDNLLVNVRVHCPAGTATVVSIVRLPGASSDPGHNGANGATTDFAAGDPSGALVSVTDDGPGLPVANAGRIFERFWRADPSRSRHHGGAGLGLAIVDAIVRAHGGTVTVESTPGRGTTFLVRLPPVPPVPLVQAAPPPGADSQAGVGASTGAL